MTHRFLGLCGGLILVGTCPAQIAYVKARSLYVLGCDASGAPKKGAKPVLICKVHPRVPKELALSWNGKGEIQLSSFDKPFGVVKAVGGAKIRKLRDPGSDIGPVASPDDSAAIVYFSYLRDKAKPMGAWLDDAFLVKKRNHLKILLQKSTDGEVIWSPNGKLIILSFRGEHDDAFSKVIAYPSLAALYELRGFAAGDKTFSPNSRTFALFTGSALESRPTTLYDSRTGKALPNSSIPGAWQTSEVADWSPDGRHYLKEYRAQDDETRWTRHCVAIANLATGKEFAIPGTTDAEQSHYSRDGSHYFWIMGKAGLLQRISSVDSARRKIIARGVTSYAIRR